jgi:hypothetical protein
MRMLLAASAVALAGCSSTSDILGAGKDAPDEFAIVTKQPLIIPPDFNLHPPRPGAAPTNQLSPTDSAQAALFSDDPSQIASNMRGNYSEGEKQLLARAGAANASDSIRQLIAADNKNLEAADTDFTNNLLFGGGDADAGHPIDANAEKSRLDSMGVGNRPVADAAPAPQQPIDDYAAPQSAYETPPAGAAQPAVGGALPPVNAPQGAQSQPVSAPPAQTASTYAPPPQAPEAGTLPPIGSTPQQTYQPSRPAKKAHKDDSGWFDGIF